MTDGTPYCAGHDAWHIGTCQQWEAAISALPISGAIARWRSVADLDSRAGAPVGKALNDAADEVVRLQHELTASVTDRERLYNMVQGLIERLQETKRDADAGWTDAENRAKELDEWAASYAAEHDRAVSARLLNTRVKELALMGGQDPADIRRQIIGVLTES